MAHTARRGYTENRGAKQQKLKKSSRISQGNWTDAKVKGGLNGALAQVLIARDRPAASRQNCTGSYGAMAKTDPTDPRRALFA
jgi:hypothetical protein